MTTFELPLDEINVGQRARNDNGSLQDLIDSIQRVGLLHPIVVTPDHRLLCGARRLLAFEALGRDRIPVTVAQDITDARLAYQAERDENTCRKDFTPSEALRFAQRLEESEQSAAKERKDRAGPSSGPGKKSGPGKIPAPLKKGDVRDLVGAAIGMSGSTYQRAKHVVQAAEVNPARYGDLVEQMDRTRRIKPAYDELRRRQGEGRARRRKTPLLCLVDELIAEAARPSEQIQVHKLRLKLKELRQRISTTQLGRQSHD